MYKRSPFAKYALKDPFTLSYGLGVLTYELCADSDLIAPKILNFLEKNSYQLFSKEGFFENLQTRKDVSEFIWTELRGNRIIVSASRSKVLDEIPAIFKNPNPYLDNTQPFDEPAFYKLLKSQKKPQVPLGYELNIDGEFGELLNLRKSAMKLTRKRGFSLPFLEKVFRGSYGITRRAIESGEFSEKRVVPSGGALFSILPFYLRRTGYDSTESYFFDGIEFVQKKLAPSELGFEELLKRVLPNNDRYKGLLDCDGIVILIGDYSIGEQKYGLSAFPLMYIESGHIMQNMSLLAAKYDFGMREIFGFNNTALQELGLMQNEKQFFLIGSIIGEI